MGADRLDICPARLADTDTGFGFDLEHCAPGGHKADTDFVNGIALVKCIRAFPKLARGGAAR